MIERDPTREEMAVFERYKRTVENGRAAMQGYLGACACMGMIEKWRENQIKTGMLSSDFLPPAFSVAKIEQAKDRAGHWNVLENGLNGLENKRFGFQVAPNKYGQMDINIYMRSEPAMLGGPVVLVVIGASVVIAGIVTALAIEKANQDNARDMKKELAFLNQRMAAAPPPVRDAFKQLQKSTDFREQKSLWDQIGKGLGNALGIGLLVLAGWEIFKKQTKINPAIAGPIGVLITNWRRIS